MRLIDAAFIPRKWGGTTWALPGACIDAETGQFMVPKQKGLTTGNLVKIPDPDARATVLAFHNGLSPHLLEKTHARTQWSTWWRGRD